MTRPRLVLVCGLLGAGKTTVAKELERAGLGIRLSPDEWLIAAGHDLSDENARDAVEAAQREVAGVLLAAGFSVILENGFWSADERARYLCLARDKGAMCDLHFCDAELSVLERRVADRNRGLPPAQQIDVGEIARWHAAFEAPDDREAQLFDSFHRH